jgi:SAM-dependent methyltransferase
MKSDPIVSETSGSARSTTEPARNTWVRGPIRRLPDGRLRPNASRPASLLNQALILDCLNAVRDQVRGDLLDVGCGEKPYEWIFGSQVERYVGCDWGATPHSLHHVDLLADAARLPFHDATFDTVLSTEVLEHVSDPARCVVELNRVLRPGGTLILTTPFLYWIHEAPHDYFRYTPYGLKALIRRAGLDEAKLLVRGNVVTVVIDLWSKWAHHNLRRLGRWGRGGRIVASAGSMIVTVPQYGYLAARALAHRLGVRPGWFSRSLAFADSVALGYVLVARNTRPADLAPSHGTATGDTL